VKSGGYRKINSYKLLKNRPLIFLIGSTSFCPVYRIIQNIYPNYQLKFNIFFSKYIQALFGDLDQLFSRTQLAFDQFFIDVVGGELRHENDSTVDERTVAGDSDHAAPGSLTDERTEARGLEARREDVAVRGGVLVPGSIDARSDGITVS